MLSLARLTAYHRLQEASGSDLALTRRTDKLHLEYPLAGGKMPRDLLMREIFLAGRRQIATLMKKTGWEARQKGEKGAAREPCI